MDARRSFYLNSPQSDFTDLLIRSEITGTDIPYIVPANDSQQARSWLSASRVLFFRLIATRFDIWD
jgi:hypothetical protein